jgi:CheY-like chemotaxis protein
MTHKILIVDDSTAVRKSIADILMPEMTAEERLSALLGNSAEAIFDLIERDYDILEASQSAEALSILLNEDSKGRPVNIVITDISMPPGYDGWELINQIRSHKEIYQPKILVVSAFTGFSTESEREKAEKEVVRIINKPFKDEDITNALEACFNA